VACACTDCGDVHEIADLTWTYGRALCVRCAHLEADLSKADAEIWILDQMIKLEALAPYLDTSSTRIVRATS
jgi:hypothetical protein